MNDLLPISILPLQGSVSGTKKWAQRYIAYENLLEGTIGRKYGFIRILVAGMDKKSV
jgi:hypothetical protein